MAGHPLSGNLEFLTRPETSQTVHEPAGGCRPGLEGYPEPGPGQWPTGAPGCVQKGAAGKQTSGTRKRGTARKGSKTAKILDLLKRPGGTTLKGLMAATKWQAHSVRGFLSGTVGKRLGLRVKSNKEANGERTYSIKA